MSNQSSSYTSFSTTSYTSSSSSNGNQPHTQSYTETSNYNSRDGGSIQRESRETGQPTLTERRDISAQGQISGPSSGPSSQAITGGSDRSRQIEDVTESEADQLYRERMEDEYAKREGGA